MYPESVPDYRYGDLMPGNEADAAVLLEDYLAGAL
jgi:hypothetical protein